MGERRSRREEERERRRHGNGLAEGLLLGAVAAGALFLGYKKTQEDRKLADTLLEVANKENQNEHGLDLTLRDVPSSFFNASAASKSADLRESALDITANALKSNPLWIYVFHDQIPSSGNYEMERRAKIRSLFSRIYVNSGNYDSDRYVLKAMYTRQNRNIDEPALPLQLSLITTLVNHANVDPVFSNPDIAGVSADVRERLVAFGRFLAARKARIFRGAGNGNFVEISRIIINNELTISDEILEACLNGLVNNVHPPFDVDASANSKTSLLACVYTQQEKNDYESHGFRVVDQINYPLQAPQTEHHNLEQSLDESNGDASHQFTCYFLTLQF